MTRCFFFFLVGRSTEKVFNSNALFLGYVIYPKHTTQLYEAAKKEMPSLEQDLAAVSRAA